MVYSLKAILMHAKLLLRIAEFKNWYDKYLRRVAPDPVDIGAELGVWDTVYFDHIYWGIVHAVVFVCQLVPCRL